MFTHPLTVAALAAVAVSAVPFANQSYPITTEPGDRPWNSIEPLQQRIAIVNSTAMAISWNTYAPLNDSQAYVEYGFDSLKLSNKAYSYQTTFLTSRTYSHHAVLTGLTPKTLYHYRVANTNCFGCSTIPTYTFKTPREPGCDQPYTIAVVADMGLMGPNGLTNVTGKGSGGTLGSDETNAIQSMNEVKDDYETIIHIGDLAYADYFLKASTEGFFGSSQNATQPTKQQVVDQYEYLNEQFYDELTPLTSSKPYMVAVGNHESNCDNGGITDKTNNITYTAAYCMPGQTNFTAYAEHWNMPGKQGDTKNFWYSFTDGLVKYIVFDSETDFGAGIYGPDEIGGTGKMMSAPRGYVGEQIDFLKKELASVDRSVTPWVLAFNHRPWYNGIGSALCKPCQQAFEQIMYDGGVDMVMNGHNHVYSRSYPVYLNQTDPNGYNNPKAPVYITNGVGGHYDGMDTNDSPLPAVIAAGIDHVYGWSRVFIANRTHIRQDFVASKNNTILDSFWLYKKH